MSMNKIYDSYYVNNLLILIKNSSIINVEWNDINDLNIVSSNLKNLKSIDNDIFIKKYKEDINSLSSHILEKGLFFPIFTIKPYNKKIFVFGGQHRINALQTSKVPYRVMCVNFNIDSIYDGLETQIFGKYRFLENGDHTIITTSREDREKLFKMKTNSSQTVYRSLARLSKILGPEILDGSLSSHKFFNNELAWNNYYDNYKQVDLTTVF